MKKSLFYWAFLAFVGMSLTACSSGDDNIADNTTPATPDSQSKTVILTGTIGVGDNDETRAITNAGVSSWSANDPITINYETSSGYSRTTGTIKTVDSDSHFATFEATLTDAKDDGYIGFAYGTVEEKTTPSSAYDFTFNYSAYYNTQIGTTAAISSSRLDFACTENGGQIKMKVDGNTATLKGNAVLKNQFSMLKINLVDKDAPSTGVNATELKITIATGENFATPKATYTITPSPATNEFYVALEPKDVGDKVKIVASFDSKDPAIKLDTDDKVNAITTTDYGKLICVYASDANKQAYLCSSSTSPKICEYTYGTDTKFLKGKLYSKQLNVKTLTPRAVIAYTTSTATNYCSKFIALALEDAIDTEITMSEAFGTYSYQVQGFPVAHGMKISGTDYARLEPWTEETTTRGLYDAVQANAYDASYHATTDVASASRTESLVKGWRIPSVTDFRLIFEQLKDDEGNPVMSGITATNPAGIMDHNGVYGYYVEAHDEVPAHWNYPYGDHADYYVGNPTLRSYINKLCLNNGKLKNQYYWLSSQVKNTSGELQASKAWRFSFANDYFMWNESSDKSLIRYVFAY